MVLLPSVGIAAEDPLGDDHCGHGLRPAGVKGEMGDRFDELFLAVAVLLGVVEVEHELVGVAARGERSDGDEAALLGRKLGALPDLAEEDVVSEPDESGGEVTEQALRARRFLVFSRVRHWALLSQRWTEAGRRR